MEENIPVYRSLVEKPNEAKSEKKLPGWRLATMALLVALGGPFHFGFQLIITNSSQEAFLQFINNSNTKENALDRSQLESIWGTLISLLFWGMTLGAFTIRWISHKVGRKRGIQLAVLGEGVCLLMAVTSYFKNDYILYGASRLFLGFFVSVGLGVIPMFITECSPKSCRGFTSMASGIMIQSALTIGAVVAMPQLFGQTDKWWYMYAGEFVICLIVFILLFFIHDSPGHLLKGEERLKAKQAIIYYYGCDDEEAANIVTSLEEEHQHHNKTLSLITVWKDPNARHGTLIGSIIMIAMVMSGIAAINAFAFEILLSVGLTVFQASIGNVIICFMTVLGILVSSMVVDHFGRRPLLLTTFLILIAVNLFIVGFMFFFQRTNEKWIGFLLLTAIALFNFIFATGPGPLSLFLTSELVGHNGRAAACTWATIFMSCVRSVLLLAYLPIKNSIGQPMSYLVLFVPPLVIAEILLYFYMPESKGLSPHEIFNGKQNILSERKEKRTLLQ